LLLLVNVDALIVAALPPVTFTPYPALEDKVQFVIVGALPVPMTLMPSEDELETVTWSIVGEDPSIAIPAFHPPAYETLAYVSWLLEDDPGLKWTVHQDPGVGVIELDVKVIGDVLVPLAMSVPTTSRYCPPLNFTVTPASMVSVTPEFTVMAPVTTYGLFASVHVVVVAIVPLTFVSATADIAQQSSTAIARACI
jgi:hypothetical protein